MLARLAGFYVLVAALDLYLGGHVVGLVKIIPGGDMYTAVGEGIATFVLGPIFNVVASFIVIKRFGRLSGFTAGLINALGFEGMMLALVGARTTSTVAALGIDLTKLAVPWALSCVPWIRRRVLARSRPGARGALFGASAHEFHDGDDVAQILALTDPLERGLRGAFSRRPVSWDESPARVGGAPRDVPWSLRLAVMTSGSSVLGWAALSLGLLCVALVSRLDRIRDIPVEIDGVEGPADILDCAESPAPSLLAGFFGGRGRYVVHYRYQVEGVSYDGTTYPDYPCPSDGDEQPGRYGLRIVVSQHYPERSLPFYFPYTEPLSWTLLLILGAVVGIHVGLGRVSEAIRGIRALRQGQLVHGANIDGFPVALATGPKRFVPILASSRSRGRLLVEVVEPRARSSARPALLVPDRGPVVPWDQLPALPGVDEAGRLLGPPWRSVLVRGLLPAVAAVLAIGAVVSWLRLFGR